MEKILDNIFMLDPQTSEISFYGKNEEHIVLIEQAFNTRLVVRGSKIKLIGKEEEINIVKDLLRELEGLLKKTGKLSTKDITTAIHVHNNSLPHDSNRVDLNSLINASLAVQTFSKTIKLKSNNQEKIFSSVFNNDLVFIVGPAGTGKTYLAVAMAVHFLKIGAVKKIVLTRPAVEAGENLGFLPGDFKEKIDPYLRPLYDALSEMIPKEQMKKYVEYESIEIVPLAYMRGRTLNNSFVILDEAQNSTFIQMKMFLTRLGQNSKAVITGDITQVDLNSPKDSGLISSIEVLKKVKKIDFVNLTEEDVVRHPLVKDIINAYDKFASSKVKNSNN